MKESLNSLTKQIVGLPGRAIGVVEALLDSLKGLATGGTSVFKILLVMVAVDQVMLGKLGITSQLVSLGTTLYTTLAGNTSVLVVLVILAVFWLARKN